MQLRHALVALVICQFAAPAAFAQPADTPRTGIVDTANVVDPATEQALNGFLEELEVKTKAQLKVLTVSTTRGRDIHDFGLDFAKQWRMGDADEDNGALVVIAVADRAWTVVTGEGIEDVLPDLKCKRIAERDFVPNFRRGDYSRGIHLGTVSLAREIAKSYNVQLSGSPPAPAQRHSARGEGRRSSRGGPACSFAFMLILIVMSLIGSAARRGRRYHRGWGMRRSGLGSALFWGSVLGGLGRSGRSGHGWSGGFGGGSFGGFGGGGFGGGGGGSFGGGGASGRW